MIKPGAAFFIRFKSFCPRLDFPGDGGYNGKTMKKVLRAILAGFFLAVTIGQGLHRHSAHDGGVSSHHVDCVVCAWSQQAHVSALPGGPAPLFFTPLALRIHIGADSSTFSGLFSTFLSRAPPASPSFL
jgi:hypothetical protein